MSSSKRTSEAGTQSEWTTLDEIHLELAIMELKILNDIDDKVDQVLEELNEQCDLLELRADYRWFKSEILAIFPLGLTLDFKQGQDDRRLVMDLAQKHSMLHIADALIDELSLIGAGIKLDRRNQSRA